MKPRHVGVKLPKITKADKRAKAKLAPTVANGLTSNFSNWQSASYESGRKVASRYHKTR